MKLSSIESRILVLQLRSIGISIEGREQSYKLAMDGIDNLIRSLHGLPEKYSTAWKEIHSRQIQGTDPVNRNSQINENHRAALGLLTSIRTWVDSMKKFPDSPSFRSGQLSSIRNKELPDLLLKEKVDRLFVTEVVTDFFDVLIQEFDVYEKKLMAYKNEFVAAEKRIKSNKQFKEWCDDFFNRVQIFFDNHCLANEYEWHIDRLEGKGPPIRKYRIPPPSGYPAPDGGWIIPPPGVTISDSPGASVVQGSHVVGNSVSTSHISDSPWRQIIITVVAGIIVALFLFYFNLNGNRKDEAASQSSSMNSGQINSER